MKTLKELSMNKAKTLLIASTLSIGSLFAAHAQSSANDDQRLAMNDKPKTEIKSDKVNPLEPAVREGHFGDAQSHSFKNNLMVVYISGAKGGKDKPEPYTAKQYAEILQKAFANPKYTDNPTNVVVYYQESGEDRVSTASVLINGKKYETKSGRTVFTPMIIGSGIDTFADAYAKTNKATALYTSKPSSETQLAVNHDR